MNTVEMYIAFKVRKVSRMEITGYIELKEEKGEFWISFQGIDGDRVVTITVPIASNEASLQLVRQLMESVQ